MLHKGSSTEDDMMIEINETTDRRTLELAAIFECDFDLDWIEQASDECGGAA
jgi:hypothetical protein